MAIGSPKQNTPLEQRMAEVMHREMQRELDSIAESIIKDALEKIDTELRRRMGSIALGLLRSSYDVRENAHQLVITVHVKESK